MLKSIRSFLQESIDVCHGNLHQQHLLFLLASGDADLDWLIEFLILSGLKKGKPTICHQWSDEVRSSLTQRENLTIIRNSSNWIEQLNPNELAQFVRDLSHAHEWKSPVLFDMGIQADTAIQALRKISSVHTRYNFGIQVNPSLPSELNFAVVIEFLEQQQIHPDDPLRERIRQDVQGLSLTYTHIRIFTQQCDRLLREKQGTGQSVYSMSPADYDAVGTLHYFVEFSGKAFLTQAESLADIQSIEWIFRSLIRIENGIPKTKELTADEVAIRSGVPVEKLTPVLQLAADFGFDLLRLSGGKYSILHRAVLEEWSDMKSWIEHELEAIQLLGKYRQLALQHAHGTGQLLTGVQLEEVIRWKQQNRITPEWAIAYFPDLELVLGYLAASEQAFKEFQAAQEKARSRRLTFAYQLAGGSVVIGVLILLLSMWAWGQKKQAEIQKSYAELEKRRSDTAYKQAEKNRQVAVKMQLEATRSEQKAINQANIALEAEAMARRQQQAAEQARIAALTSLKAEEKAKILELQAKQDAIKERERAEDNEKKARTAETDATNNARRADRLRVQQESRANALAVYEDFDNAQFETGRAKASHAYDQFVKNGGNPFDRDILTVLMEGAFRHQPTAYSTPVYFQPIQMAEDPRKQHLALYGMDKKVKLFDLSTRNFSRDRQITETLRGFGFVDERSLAGATSTFLQYELFDRKSIRIPSVLTGKEIRKLFTFPDQTSNVWISTREKLYSFRYAAQGFQLVDSFSLKDVTQLRNMGDFWVCSSGNQLLRLEKKSSKWLPLAAPGQVITALSGLIRGTLLAVGDEAGNLFILNAKTGELTAERAKLHMSKISGLETIAFKKETDILVSAGFDHYVHIFYMETDRLRAAGLPSPVSLREHKRWITGLAIDPKQFRAITCSVDEQVRYWPLNPESFLFKGSMTLTPTKKK